MKLDEDFIEILLNETYKLSEEIEAKRELSSVKEVVEESFEKQLPGPMTLDFHAEKQIFRLQIPSGKFLDFPSNWSLFLMVNQARKKNSDKLFYLDPSLAKVLGTALKINGTVDFAIACNSSRCCLLVGRSRAELDQQFQKLKSLSIQQAHAA